jgi:L-asparaginase
MTKSIGVALLVLLSPGVIAAQSLPRVYLLATGGTIVASGVRGIVFAGPGPAGLSRPERAAIEKMNELPAATRPIILRASRSGNGRATGAGPEYVNLQTLTADNLTPHKARILLMLALTRTSDPAELRRILAEY